MFVEKTQGQDEFLAEVSPEEIGGEVILEDPVLVDRQIQKIAGLRAQQEKLRALAQAEISQVKNWLDAKIKTLQGTIDFFSQPLETYVRNAHRKSGGKVKSLDLPHGKLKLRAQQEKFIYDDPMILSWAERHPTDAEKFLELKRCILHDQLKKLIKEIGLAVDGVTIEPAGEPKFYLEIKE